MQLTQFPPCLLQLLSQAEWIGIFTVLVAQSLTVVEQLFISAKNVPEDTCSVQYTCTFILECKRI